VRSRSDECGADTGATAEDAGADKDLVNALELADSSLFAALFDAIDSCFSVRAVASAGVPTDVPNVVSARALTVVPTVVPTLVPTAVPIVVPTVVPTTVGCSDSEGL
jgi:hypothetical protein